MSTVVRARLAPGRSIDADSFTDLTDTPGVVTWAESGLLEVTFDTDLDPAVARAIRCRVLAGSDVEEQLMGDLADLSDEAPATVEARLTRLEAMVEVLVQLRLGGEA